MKADQTPLPAMSVIVDDPCMLRRGDRERLPTRRPSSTIEVTIGQCRVRVTRGYHPITGKLLEVWIDLPEFREGTTVQTSMNDIARSISLALQLGGSLAKVASLYRHTRYEPAGDVRGHGVIKSATSIPDFVAQLMLHDIAEAACTP